MHEKYTEKQEISIIFKKLVRVGCTQSANVEGVIFNFLNQMM